MGNDVPLVGQRQVPIGLASGAVNTGTVNAVIPATTPPGSYFLLACADAAGAIPETNEWNNCRFSSGKMAVGLPDLAEESVTTAETVWAAGYLYPIHIGYKTLNNSPIPTPQVTYTKYWASTDFNIGNDVCLGERAVAAGLVSGREPFGTYNLTIPSNIPPGSYYLFACADAAGAVAETDEGNNCRFGTQKITVGLSDLTMVAASIPPAVVTPGDSIVVTDTVRNLTSVPPNHTIHTNYFLSADLTMGNDVNLTESRKVGDSLAAGADSTGTISINIPSTVPLGAYYLLACVDTYWQVGSQGFVTESNENNNCLFAQTGIIVDRPDLRVAAVSTPAVSAPYGGKVTVTETTLNAGKVPPKLKAPASGGGSTPAGHDTFQTPAPTSITNWYFLSTDPSVGNDVFLGGRQVAPGLAAGASDPATVNVTVPGNTVIGTYYLIACTDYRGTQGGDVVESNEGNNCTVAPRQLVIRNPQAGDVF